MSQYSLSTIDEQRITEILAQKIGLKEIKLITDWAQLSHSNKEYLWQKSCSEIRRISVNSLWALSHLQNEIKWLTDKQSCLIERLLAEHDTSKKRILLQLLREQNYSLDAPHTLKLLDYCLSKINSQCEPYAIRCFSLYTAFKICRLCPELITELNEYIDLLSVQTLSPGLKSALRQTRYKISHLKYCSRP